MRDIILTLDRFGDQALLLGRVGENRATRVLIDLKSILSQYPDAIASITVKQPDRAEYPAAVKQEGGILTWEITSADIGDKAGSGQAQITIQDADGTIIKTAIATTRVAESLGSPQSPAPDPVKGWVANAEEILADVKRSGTAAQTIADEVKRKLDAGELTGAPGRDGAPGEPGKDAPQEAVLYTAQTLDEAQKAQARENIGAADAARQNVLVGSETGNPIAVDDAFAAPLCGLTVYGRSTQDGTPTPDAPVPIASAGDGGSVAVTLSDGKGKTQTLTLPTPNGLPGIPVTSGGNYTDSTGQQWVCDEVDLERGVMVQRISKGRVNTSNGSINEQYRLALTISGSEGKDGSFPSVISITPYTSWTSCVSGTSLYLKNIAKSEGSFYTAEELKALAIDVDFVYQLATPIETLLTPAELAAYKALTTYAPDTVVQASDGAGVKLGYQRDANIVIKKLEDAIASMTAT